MATGQGDPTAVRRPSRTKPTGKSGARFAPGSALGPYQIVELLGAGGMGEVHRARDQRLGRDVAIKALHAEAQTDSEALARFETEARAAGTLNHANIVAIYDVGKHDGVPYVVTELLAGQTLREKLDGGPLPWQRALRLAREIAQGLAAAHERSIVHRDIKPENLFITDDGHVKILDFGLAKLIFAEGPGAKGQDPTVPAKTTPGAVMGTAGYMAPEQVRGQSVDLRVDLFAFGTVLYEMISGRRAFQGDTPAETVAAILRDDPEELSTLRPEVPPALSELVRSCMEKRAENRFQSARDLVLALDAIGGSASTSRVPRLPRQRRLRPWIAAFAAAGLAAAALVYVRTRDDAAPAGPQRVEPPSFHQVGFGSGLVSSARFASIDTVLYSRFDPGRHVSTYLARLDGRAARPIFDDMAVLGLSSGGDVAVLTGTQVSGLMTVPVRGTLARLPLIGGAPRALEESVTWADWTPTGELAAVHAVDGRFRVESPVGKVLVDGSAALSQLRAGRDGSLAFIEHPIDGDDRGRVVLVEPTGKRRALTAELASAWGLAWAPDGSIWFTAVERGALRELMRVTVDGKLSSLLRAPINLTLHDVSPAGVALLSAEREMRRVFARGPGAADEHELSLYDWTVLSDLAADGRAALVLDESDPQSDEYRVFVRPVDGSPGTLLGDAEQGRLSPDGRWVLVSYLSHRDQLGLLPAGAGQARVVAGAPALAQRTNAAWFPDGKRIFFAGRAADGPWRIYVQPAEGGEARPISGDGVQPVDSACITADGKWIPGVDDRGGVLLYSTEELAPRPIAGVGPGDEVLQITADGKRVYVKRGELVPAPVLVIDVETGATTPFREISPPLGGGLPHVRRIVMSRDGASYAYDVRFTQSDLFVVNGLR